MLLFYSRSSCFFVEKLLFLLILIHCFARQYAEQNFDFPQKKKMVFGGSWKKSLLNQAHVSGLSETISGKNPAQNYPGNNRNHLEEFLEVNRRLHGCWRKPFLMILIFSFRIFFCFECWINVFFVHSMKSYNLLFESQCLCVTLYKNVLKLCFYTGIYCEN